MLPFRHFPRRGYSRFFLPALLLHCVSLSAQTGPGPWEHPLMMASSSDGITFSSPVLYQDSSGVPSLVRWRGDTLTCAFQWFRQPAGSPTWDRVAVRFSYDNGLTWQPPVPITVNGLPSTYQRPFDPALCVIPGDSLRIYFSSSDGLPMGADSIINTYSAVSADGINYQFEPGARVDEPLNRVIDPSVIFFNHSYHYLAPAGSPQQGAYHYLSPDGVHFTKVPDIPSDSIHNWTGNYMVNDSTQLRFYGSAPSSLWFSSSPNGGTWNGYQSTTIHGGDPAVCRIDSAAYILIFTGPPYPTALHETELTGFRVFPNPAASRLCISWPTGGPPQRYRILDHTGRGVQDGILEGREPCLNIEKLPAGMYILSLAGKTNLPFSVDR
jgi:hypothetical protein